MVPSVRHWFSRVLVLAARLVAAGVAISVGQVLVVRWVDPPFTLTMVDRAWVHFVETGHATWPDTRPVTLEAMGPTVPRAIVASEDARFFLHGGFDWTAICAAVQSNAEGRRLRGGSTLSQQVAKNVFLWQRRSWLRKGLEAWYTLLLESLVPKERILELYLNVAETGPMVFGAEAGAQHHFQRSAAALSPEEAGRLAGLLPDPRHRMVSGSSAGSRARFVLANPAPFPGDPRFDLMRDAFAREPGWRGCLP